MHTHYIFGVIDFIVMYLFDIYFWIEVIFQVGARFLYFKTNMSSMLGKGHAKLVSGLDANHWYSGEEIAVFSMVLIIQRKVVGFFSVS